MKMKLTPWFPKNTRPDRNGLYETRVGAIPAWSVWCEGKWHFASTNKNSALAGHERKHVSLFQQREWRGLVEKSS